MRLQTEIVSGPRTLRGITHVPDIARLGKVVSMFPGIDGTKVGPNRIFLNISEALEAEGVASVRYDLSGQGDSDGQFSDINYDNIQNDMEAVVESIVSDQRFSNSEVTVLGYSLGGLWAALIAARMPHLISKVIMLSPVLHHPAIVAGTLAKLPPDVTTLNVWGNTQLRSNLEKMASVNVTEILEGIQADMLMVTGSRDEMVPRSVYQEFMQGVLARKCTHIEVSEANHSFSHPAWQDVAIKLVSNFVTGRPVLPKAT